MNKLLLVDDDNDTTSRLQELLQYEEFTVHIAKTGEAALEMMDSSYDLILLDIMLPGLNGMHILSELRKKHIIPIILLTAKESPIEKVIGLELGADDYIIKPFDERELIARIRALLRRRYWDNNAKQENNQQPNEYIIDQLVVNPKQQVAYFNNRYIDLTGTEFQILLKLIMSNGEIITRNELSESVLGKKFLHMDRSVDMHVSNLRKKLPLRSDGLPWIKTLRSKGYLFIFDKKQPQERVIVN